MLHYATQFANALSEFARVRLILPKKKPNAYEGIGSQVELELVTVREYFSRRHLWKTPLYAFSLPRVIATLRKDRPRITHITDTNSWICNILPFINDARPVWTLHDPKPHLGYGGSEFTKRMLARYSRRIFVHYSFNRAMAIELGYDPAKLVVIPHGNYNFFERYKRSDIVTRRMVLFWGHIQPYKGVHTLIDAAEWLPSNVEIVIAGSGAGIYRPRVNNDARFSIIDKFLSEQEIAELFQAAAVIVLPYLEATQSGIVPVAYTFSKPLVATITGGVPEQVKDGITGYLVRPADPRSLAEATLKILDDPQLAAAMGSAGHATTLAEMSWRRVAEIACTAYKQALAKS